MVVSMELHTTEAYLPKVGYAIEGPRNAQPVILNIGDNEYVSGVFIIDSSFRAKLLFIVPDPPPVAPLPYHMTMSG